MLGRIDDALQATEKQLRLQHQHKQDELARREVDLQEAQQLEQQRQQLEHRERVLEQRLKNLKAQEQQLRTAAGQAKQDAQHARKERDQALRDRNDALHQVAELMAAQELANPDNDQSKPSELVRLKGEIADLKALMQRKEHVAEDKARDAATELAEMTMRSQQLQSQLHDAQVRQLQSAMQLEQSCKAQAAMHTQCEAQEQLIAQKQRQVDRLEHELAVARSERTGVLLASPCTTCAAMSPSQSSKSASSPAGTGVPGCIGLGAPQLLPLPMPRRRVRVKSLVDAELRAYLCTVWAVMAVLLHHWADKVQRMHEDVALLRGKLRVASHELHETRMKTLQTTPPSMQSTPRPGHSPVPSTRSSSGGGPSSIDLSPARRRPGSKTGAGGSQGTPCPPLTLPERSARGPVPSMPSNTTSMSSTAREDMDSITRAVVWGRVSGESSMSGQTPPPTQRALGGGAAWGLGADVHEESEEEEVLLSAGSTEGRPGSSRSAARSDDYSARRSARSTYTSERTQRAHVQQHPFSRQDAADEPLARPRAPSTSPRTASGLPLLVQGDAYSPEAFSGCTAPSGLPLQLGLNSPGKYGRGPGLGGGAEVAAESAAGAVQLEGEVPRGGRKGLVVQLLGVVMLAASAVLHNRLSQRPLRAGRRGKWAPSVELLPFG